MHSSKVVELDLTSRKSHRKSTRQSFLDHVRGSIIRHVSFVRARTAEELFHVRCSRPVFALCWFGILLLHCVCAAYFSAAAYLYLYIMPISIGSNLRRYALRLTLEQYKWIAYAHGAFAAPHGICILQMLGYSLGYRRLVFESATSSRISSNTITSRLHSKMGHSRFCSAALSRKIFYWRKWLFGHTGLFGLGGPHFRTITLIQETTEIVLQTIQAYRMSCWLPRVWLTRNYVALLVLNCWSTSVIQRFTGDNLPLERLLVFLAALLTDLAAIIAIPMALVYPYFGMWAPERSNFARSYWYDDIWLINMVNEAQIILVTSVWDILGRLTFATSLLMTFMVVKSLIKPVTAKVGTVAAVASAPSVHAIDSSPLPPVSSTLIESFASTPVVTFASNKSATKELSAKAPEATRTASTLASLARHSFMPRRSMIPGTSTFAGPRYFAVQDKLVHRGHQLFLLWGLLIVIVQIQADHLPEPELCGLRVRPWFQSKPSCSLLEVDCYKLNLTGAVDEIKSAMDKMNQPVLAHVVFRHCPNLQMPPNLQSLSQLIGFKVFNSTLTLWEQDAALTNTHHPYLTFMFMVRVNMTEIPRGLQTNDYPKRLTDVEFSITNLTTLPADLHTKWPKSMVLVLERGQFQVVPETLKYLHVGYLGLGENNFSVVPPELFTNPHAKTLWLNGNPITRLPADVAVSSSLLRIRVVSTNVSVETLPAWIPTKFLNHAPVNAGNTPLCKKIVALKAAKGNMSELGESLAKVYAKIDCTVPKGDNFTYYPLSFEDKYAAGAELPGP